jgi:hypothetical protein
MKRVIPKEEKFHLLILHASGDEVGGDDAYEYGLDLLCKEEIGLVKVKDREARWFDVWTELYTYDTDYDRKMAIHMLETTTLQLVNEWSHHIYHLYEMTQDEVDMYSTVRVKGVKNGENGEK